MPNGHMIVREHGNTQESRAPFQRDVSLRKASLNKDSLQIDMEIRFPKKEPKQQKGRDLPCTRHTGSMLSTIFLEQKYPEPVYFQSVDCVAFPEFLSSGECQKIIDFAEAQGFSQQNRHRLSNMMWTDVVDPFFAEALWQMCGLGWFLRNLQIDGKVPCGINDVLRIQKFGKGGMFGRHTDKCVARTDGRTSMYSLRIFLNTRENKDFEGGLSAFHVIKSMVEQPPPVIFEPELGLALLYPQGEFGQVREEMEVTAGCKYVLRADVLFQGPLDVVSPHVPFHHPSPSCGRWWDEAMKHWMPKHGASGQYGLKLHDDLEASRLDRGKKQFGDVSPS